MLNFELIMREWEAVPSKNCYIRSPEGTQKSDLWDDERINLHFESNKPFLYDITLIDEKNYN